MKLKYAIYFFVSIAVLTTWLYIGTNWIEVTHHRIVMSRLPESFSPLKIIYLSDLHGKDFGKDNAIIVETIKKENPDLIILSGDMINSNNDNGSATVALLKAIAPYYPVYYALGNHELYCRLNTPDIYSAYEAEIIKTGCHILDNEKISLHIKGVQVDVYGLSSIPYKKRVNTTYLKEEEFDADYINEKLGNSSEEEIDILIAHDPSWFKVYREWGADIVFSGHIHGGAVRLPFIGGLVSPNHEFFPKYDSGLFQEDSRFMYVSRGLGTSVERIRIFNRPEIAVFTVE